ncbi:hypothetical protein [Chitinophaga nivalis]|uniref:Knr4/Smi1-like domain-containing protein n=1 Tax=Chitinophaga nivalis TaxID=2991709 RepID=A0ABT3IMT4_9BACT|nr:hypothetical protein [Chitinophaga nivalis]MCW3465032.1 hypothetical protein [Chitinophaga nivalis]MCW3485276.1 hypothetical protein [Chitinophaga nivalis]
MQPLIRVPENYTEFLYWVKERTESFWRTDPADTTLDFKCEPWIHGAKWQGLTDTEIDQIEKKYAIRFSPAHREFLRILHTIDRKEVMEYKETFEEDAPIQKMQRPFFYNWLTDDQEIKERFEWPYETILSDILGVNDTWQEAWGPRPKTPEEQTTLFSQWYHTAPPLIPITSHRFSLSAPDLPDAPILSVYGSDIIVYGWNFRHYLLNELVEHLNLCELVYDEEDQCHYAETLQEIKAINEWERAHADTNRIPVWKEML